MSIAEVRMPLLAMQQIFDGPQAAAVTSYLFGRMNYLGYMFCTNAGRNTGGEWQEYARALI